ncbi:LOW QUALITY PROTEIN: kunitz-type protease inhibitor 1-like [Cottoperca gobio]|uniref:LOW QUALITY PROTEIN: kunitz-type protease inhibitor 1-like n=1 Tax=Cottoperca gobio TaxID=56716 RepID=A0A6J2PAE1_COTGO|nr:LOW QUALITY PROTEIN: kunitz-type protease inhibitor 1-like [Cottoperca gobio]
MPPSYSSSSLLLPLLLLLLLLLPFVRPTGAAEDADCSGAFRAGPENFVLDTEDAVKEGAALLTTAHVRSEEACISACCGNPRCNLALLEPRGTAAAGNHTCDLFNCVHNNRFVCRFVNQAGYLSFIRDTEFMQHLQGPQHGAGEQAPPIAIAGRDVIVQPGDEVTLNGIQSLALGDAHIAEYHWTQQSGDGVEMQKTDLPDQVRLSNLQPGSYDFRLTVTDSNDQSHSANVTVLVLSPELSSLYCLAPPKVGPCRAMFPRWRYNAAVGECKQFVFGGCKSNHNNFLSKEECDSACTGVTATSERSVTLPTAEECGPPCRPNQLICRSGCCLDRSLECDGVMQCSDGSDEEPCSKLNQTFNRLLDIDVNQRKARCSEPPLTGPCRASFTRWYYDPLNRKCSRFTYGGCEGSENNFEEEEKCSETCKGVTEDNVFFRGMFFRFGAEDESDSGNIALAVCLSVAILALLAILTYCFLKSRKERSHRPVAAGPAHVALSEQDTLVYNSTTKPV